MGKKSNGKSLLQRLRFKYKLAILNENTLEEVWRIRLSKLSVIAFSFFVAVVYFFLIALLIIKTPLRGFLPGYTDNARLRKTLVLTAIQIDSIADRVQVQTQYLNALRTVVSGQVPFGETTSKDSLLRVSTDQLLAASDREKAFRDSFEAERMGETSLGLAEQKNQPSYLMNKPAQGRILEPFNPHRGSYGVTLAADPNTSVSAVLDGVVISSEYSLNDVHLMLVQHTDNLLSVYKLHQPYMKKVGDKVHAGEILSTFLRESDTYFEFQLWKNGAALDPQVYIAF